MRKLVLLLAIVVLGVVGAYVAAGFMPRPSVTITKPGKFAGASVPVAYEVNSDAPLSSVRVFFEQNGVRTEVPQYPVTQQAGADKGPFLNKVNQTAEINAAKVPNLKVQAGPARVIVVATSKVWKIRTLASETAADVTIRLEKPRVSPVSTKHYINLGGSEMIVYRATPADATSGVMVGDIEYPGFATTGDLHIAFFALRYDQDVNTPMKLFARDVSGETATSEFDHLTFNKPFKKSTIQLDDKFIDRVVPAILAGTTEIAPTGTTIEKYVAINSELRKKNNATIASMAAKTAPTMLWTDVFYPFTNTKAEAAFADFRTYVYQGKEVDRQVHLGFDLASFANTSVVAANKGTVLFAQELGIYGNCVIVDHGMGVQSLYGHLSSFTVKAGDSVDKGQELGKSGMTGLAGGDHLHFTMLVNGQMVNPIEWWDSHWIADRITRKLHEG
jgi:murein DD-endopeptidase MepM/ murein hydrolase activator NlpD